MLRLLFAALAALTLLGGQTQAQSQLLLGAGGSKRAAAAYVGPGDIVSGATAWYGLRAYTTAIAAAGTQSIVDLRRASDSATCTAKIATNGFVDLTVGTPCNGGTETVTTWVGASSALVSKWYDQSGNADDAVQATAANQPQLVLTGGPFVAAPYIAFASASSSRMVSGTLASTSAPITYSFVSYTVAGALTIPASSNGATSIEIWADVAANRLSIASSSRLDVVANDAAWHATQAVGNAASSSISTDGATTSGTIGAFSAFTTVTLGARANNSFFWSGRLVEFGLWPVSFSAGDQIAVNANQHSATNGWNF